MPDYAKGTIPGVESIIDRKAQLRELFEASGLFAYLEPLNTESDIYAVNQNPLLNAKLSYIFRGVDARTPSSVVYNPTDTTYAYLKERMTPPAVGGIGDSSVPFVYHILPRTASNAVQSALLPTFSASLTYVWVNRPSVKYLNLNGRKMFGAISESGKMLFCSAIAGSQYTSVKKWFLENAPGVSTVGNYGDVRPFLYTPQYGFSQNFTFDEQNYADRMIMCKMPLDYFDEGSVTKLDNCLTNDAIPDLFSFSNQAKVLQSSAMIGDEVYTDTATGKKFLYAATGIMIKLED